MSQSDLEAIELDMEHMSKLVNMADTVKRLMTSPDFKKVILEGYFREEAIRLSHFLSDGACLEGNRGEDVILRIKAIGYLRQYLEMLEHFGEQARKSLLDSEEMREELAQGALDE